LKLKTLVTFCVVFAAVLGSISLGTLAATNSAQDSSTISYTMTTTTNYLVTTGGVLQVNFDSIQLTQAPPQAYSFGVVARTFPGLWITRVLWQFGDGGSVDVPYCCQSRVSEVRYHTYANPGPYTVYVVAFDNAGNAGTAAVTVDWVTPIPEYPNYSLSLAASLLVVFVALAALRRGIGPKVFRPFFTKIR
jgi:PKD repeat protein